jgi:formylglycine-generating enzyme required for sulfatase activity
VRRFEVNIRNLFGEYEDKIVVQLFDNNEILDECILRWPSGEPWLISISEKTEPVNGIPDGMVYVRGGNFIFNVTTPDQFIPYPDYSRSSEIQMHSFWMDKYPVTNDQYRIFREQTGYSVPGFGKIR